MSRCWVITGAMLVLLSGCALSDNRTQSAPARPGSSALALTNATVVDVHSGQLRRQQTVIISGNRITAAGDTVDIGIPARARVIDAGGRYLIPGLIDTHVHFLSEWADPPIDAATYFSWILAGGVTSVREMSWDGFERALALRADAGAGRFVAPRIYVSAGPDPGQPDSWASLLRFTKGRDPAAAVRRVRALGIDGLKLHNFSRDTMLKVIELARDADLPVYGHTLFSTADRPPTYENFTLDLVRAGINGVVHMGALKPAGVDDRSAPTLPRSTAEGRRAWASYNRSAWQRTNDADVQALIDTMVARRVWYEPTLLVVHYWDHQDLYDPAALPFHHPWRTRPEGRPSATMRTVIEQSEAAEQRFIQRFHAAGGMIIAGTDEAPFPPFGVTEEMRLLVEAGLPPLAALQAATINAARALRWDDRVGSLQTGKLADLVLLDANPLNDITNVRRIHAVVADGGLLDRAALDEFLRRAGMPVRQAPIDNDAKQVERGTTIRDAQRLR